MDWQTQLITIYLYICKEYQSGLWVYAQRFAPHVELKFTDEEVISLYWFGVMEEHRTLKQTYRYADRHLRNWFPELPTYTAYVTRLNRLADVFAPLLERVQAQSGCRNQGKLLVDSFPVALAHQGHCFKARVAPELAGHGYCSTKKLHFYGVRVHIIGRKQAGTLPVPEYVGVLPANEHDGKAFDLIRPVLIQEEIFGDKASNAPMPTKLSNASNSKC